MIYLGLGSNLGNKEHNLALAKKYISQIAGVEQVRASGLYFTEPWGYADQDWFCNQALELSVAPPPLNLLAAVQEIELILGRKREASNQYAPRIIDIDILLYNDVIFEHKNLVLPHPHLHKRAFALIPLLELNSKLLLQGQSMAHILQNLDYSLEGNNIYQR